MAEDRPLNLNRWGNRSRQPVLFRDWPRSHFEIRSDDPNVEIASWSLHDYRGQSLTHGDVLEADSKTDDSVSVYSSLEDRPRHADMTIRFRGSTRRVLDLVIALNVMAFIAWLLQPSDSDYVGRAAVLVVPTTFATAIILSRADSSFAAGRQSIRRLVLIVATLVLWIAVLEGLVSFDKEEATEAAASANHGCPTC